MATDKHAIISGTVKDIPRRTDDLLQRKRYTITNIAYASLKALSKHRVSHELKGEKINALNLRIDI